MSESGSDLDKNVTVVQSSSESKKSGTGPNKSDWEWHDRDNQPYVWKFSSVSSISSVICRTLGDSPSVRNVLSYFLTDKFSKMVTTETNVPYYLCCMYDEADCVMVTAFCSFWPLLYGYYYNFGEILWPLSSFICF